MMIKLRLLILCCACLSADASFAQSQCPLSEAPVNLVNPTLVGNGTPGSCTQSVLQTALNAGGHILCNCGSGPVTIVLSSPLNVTQNTVLDGASLVTLDGNNLTRIIDKGQNVDFTLQKQS
ncbi:MAG: hypothetical protein IPL46_22350 [Saprospiraceae bacterium]|nr:hypothetical protein [Saprospiraceae bacterium]